MNEEPGKRFGGAAAALVMALVLVGCGVVPRAPPSAVAGLPTVPADDHPLPISPEPASVVVAAPPESAIPAPPAEPVVLAPPADPLPPPQVGVASWYGLPFHGRRTANGERYDMHALTAAHPSLPMHSFVAVRHVGNQRVIVVRINDRGPFKFGRIIDLSRAAARLLGMLGVAQVEVVRLPLDDVRVAALAPAPAGRSKTAIAPGREHKPPQERARQPPAEPPRRSVSASAARRPAGSG